MLEELERTELLAPDSQLLPHDVDEPPSEAQLEEIIRQETDRYFTTVLPRFIHTYYRGGGYEFLWRMLDAHDRRDLSAGDHAPSAKAVRMAAAARGVCPIRIVPYPRFDGRSLVLGMFLHATLTRGLVIDSDRSVEIYAGSFLRLGLMSETLLRHEILHTVFHEYIHYFESFLLRREQPLRGREHNDHALEHLTFEQAKRLDRRSVTWRIAKWSALVMLASILGVVISSAPKSEVPQLYTRTPAEEASAAAVAALGTKRAAEEEEALASRVTAAVVQQLSPADAEAFVQKAPVYRSYAAAAGNLVSPEMLSVDGESADAGDAGIDVEEATATVYWLLGYSHFPPRLLGITWTTAGAHLVHATLAPRATRTTRGRR